MLSSPANSIRRNLFLHMPLWVCICLALSSVFLPEKFQQNFFIILFFFYFLLRFFWHVYLKKRGDLEDTGGGLSGVIFWGIIGGMLFYVWIPLNTPKLVVYTDEENSGRENNTQPIGKYEGQKEFLSDLGKSVNEELYVSAVCTYAKQAGLLDECSERSALSLDNDPETLEVLLLKGNPRSCERGDCQIWLIQMTAEQLARFRAYLKQEPKTEPFIASANIIADWESVLLPVRIGSESSSGWRQLQITYVGGEVEQWNGVGLKP